MAQVALDAGFDSILLGRLGRELAHVYHDALNAPLPARLQALIDQLGEDDGLMQRSRDSSDVR